MVEIAMGHGGNIAKGKPHSVTQARNTTFVPGDPGIKHDRGGSGYGYAESVGRFNCDPIASHNREAVPYKGDYRDTH